MKRGRGGELGPALDRVVKSLDRRSGGGFLNARVQAIWPEVAGPAIAAHTAKAHLRGNELNVYVDSPIWATELTAMSEMLRRRLNEELGKDVVRSVRFTVSREATTAARESAGVGIPGGPGADAGREEQRVEPVPLTEREREDVERSVSGISDETVRDAVLRATVRQLEWSKGLEAASEPQAPREGARGTE